MEIERRGFLKTAAMLSMAGPFALQQHAKESHSKKIEPVFFNLDEVHWEKMAPVQPDGDGARVAILHVHPETGATQLLIKVPAGFYSGYHWHSANETNTVIKGKLTFACGGHKKTQGVGGFNLMPARMPHVVWVEGKEEAITYTTVDGAWDVNFIVDNDPRVPAWVRPLQKKAP